ncbi:MAG: hypothetical protein HS117_02955 [Verrucomicrobiaceae bacterium]|nr:hypothetical protein [Verrucomicrobiaceae bacterium]
MDIAGSTAFKSSRPSEVQPWLPTLYRFFSEFPIQLANRYQSNEPSPRLWKTLGDEIVFVTEITDHRQVSSHLCRFRDAISHYREVVKEADKKLDLKGAAWLAGFPVGNTMLTLRHGRNNTQEMEDFVGPSIDCGFRLSKHASPRKFVISVETALMVAGTGHKSHDKPAVHAERGEELKGILGGRPYPKLWIEVPFRDGEKLHKLEETLFDPPHPPPDKDVFDYCKLFIQEHGSPLFQPFISGDSDFSEEPPGFPENLEIACALWKNLVPTSDGEPKHKRASLPEQQVKKQIAQLAGPPRREVGKKRR